MWMFLVMACVSEHDNAPQKQVMQPQPMPQMTGSPSGAGNRPEPEIKSINYYDRVSKGDQFSESGIVHHFVLILAVPSSDTININQNGNTQSDKNLNN